jgi:predicted DNA-binding protein (UPF0251 family)
MKLSPKQLEKLATSQLTERELMVLNMRQRMTLQAIADSLKVSRQYIDQVLQKARAKIKAQQETPEPELNPEPSEYAETAEPEPPAEDWPSDDDFDQDGQDDE